MSSEQIKVGDRVTWADDATGRPFLVSEVRRGFSDVSDVAVIVWVSVAGPSSHLAPLSRLRRIEPSRADLDAEVGRSILGDTLAAEAEQTRTLGPRRADIQWHPGPLVDTGDITRAMAAAYMTQGEWHAAQGIERLDVDERAIAGTTIDYIVIDDPHKPDGNADCPRCGGRRWVMLDTVEHVGPCETADDVEPMVVGWKPPLGRHRVPGGCDGERVFVASGRRVEAKHPTRDGAIAAWREKLRERGMR